MRPSTLTEDPPSSSDATALTDELIDLGRRAGLAAVGVAGAEVFSETRADLLDRRSRGFAADMQFTYRNPKRSTDPARILPGARALVVGAWGYRRNPSDDAGGPAPDQETSGLSPTGRVAAYAQRDHYGSLRQALARMASRLETEGWRTVVVCDDNALVDRAAARRAGIGWFGKNSLMLLPGLGSWFVLGTVVTDAPLVTAGGDAPMDHGEGCGTCSRCMTACPTGALVAPGVLDARRCLAWLVQAAGSFPTEHRRALGGRIYGCDECQQVCPVNRLADRRHPAGPPEADTQSEVPLLELLAATDDQLLETYGRWYVPRRDPRYLRRNALVALGNVGDGRDPATVSALRRWISCGDPLLEEHARWAAEQLGRPDLTTAR
jgi:epoxyqueuosine reductase